MKVLRKGSGSRLMITLALLTGACSSEVIPPEHKPDDGSSCIPVSVSPISSGEGSALVFWPDPMVNSGLTLLGPGSSQLDQYRVSVQLSRLSGRGVLEGRYVDVRNGLSCAEGFSAFSERNEFTFSHRDERFQEVMAYHVGDSYRSMLDSAGYLDTQSPIRIVSPCRIADNAYYMRATDAAGRTLEKVCLGISLATPGASYADDASVTAHELQHGATGNTYSVNQDLNVFFYDEAGALNEAISDFMALLFVAPGVGDAFDPRIFGRWALGTFIPSRSSVRGAHKCPQYDPDYPRCSGFPGFSSSSNTVSYVYPDGLGWPFPRNFGGPGVLRSTYLGNRNQEEIHNTGLILVGALWDAYEAIEASRDSSSARRLLIRGVMEAIKHLPKSTLSNLSPVTFRGFAQSLVDFAPAVGFAASDTSVLIQALAERGLYGGPTLVDTSWSAADPAEPYRVLDHPGRLKAWLYSLGSDPAQVTHGDDTGLNKELDPGEVATLWFNIRNNSEVTAGGVLLKIRSLNPLVTFLDGRSNVGALSPSETQIQYSKINGTAIVSALASGNPAYDVPTANNYFKTNPFFDQNLMTAVWIRVADSAPRGSTASFEVTSIPSNGVASTTTFHVPIR